MNRERLIPALVLATVLGVGSLVLQRWVAETRDAAIVMVVIWFTHPVMELLAKVPFFRDGHKASGLSADRIEVTPRYRGAGRISAPSAGASDAPDHAASEPERELVTAQSVTPAPRTADDGRRMTIAERRAAERKAAAGSAEATQQAQNEEKH